MSQRTDATASAPADSRGRGPNPIVLLLAIVGMVIVLAAGTILFGRSSHANPSGSVQGAIEAATEYYTLAGVNVDTLQITAVKSLANPHWARFEAVQIVSQVGATRPYQYGYELFAAHHWTVVAAGTSNVGCAVAGTPRTSWVPAQIINGFGEFCPN